MAMSSKKRAKLAKERNNNFGRRRFDKGCVEEEKMGSQGCEAAEAGESGDGTQERNDTKGEKKQSRYNGEARDEATGGEAAEARRGERSNIMSL